MNYRRLLRNVINSISLESIPDTKDGIVKVCNDIQQTAIGINHPFQTFEDQCVYCYTGTYWVRIEDFDLKVFLKYAYEKMSGNKIKASQRETVEGLFKQFPYTVMGLTTGQDKEKINFLNGTLELKTGNLMRHSYQDYFRYVLPYNYDPDATCQLFMKYLDRVLPDKDTQKVLAEYTGWIFTSLKLEKCLFLYGSGRNGKSVFVDIVESLLGKENISHESLSDMCGGNGDRSRANLSGKLLNTCSDVAPNAFSGDIFKRIASGEPISTRLLYKDVATLTDYAKMIFCLNELPKTNDKSNGYFRRFLIIPFNIQIPKSEVDPKLAEKIASTELPGIMNWVLEGRRRLIAQSGFTESSLCQKQLEEYRYGSGIRKKVNLILPDGFK
ncbi:DNA primase family protein [Bacteroides gallinarum]|uniref:DNA primase family protein n=1 Tax=Bacteroides gallinarum TaxID=376806 RepID=UPI0003A82F25|nr:phage/plasmid primase, P4 family [Bacteroides gallinarum]